MICPISLGAKLRFFRQFRNAYRSIFRSFDPFKSRQMKKIQMVDLQGQYAEIKDRVTASMQEVIDNASFINGPEVHAFQKELEAYFSVQ